MTLKDSILHYIEEHGPKTDAELATHFHAKQPSVRRSRGELVKEQKLALVGDSLPPRWGRVKQAKKPAKKIAPEDRFIPPAKVDWRDTDFTF